MLEVSTDRLCIPRRRLQNAGLLRATSGSTVTIPLSIQEFWSTFNSTVGHDPSDHFYEAFHFDDNAPSADELAALVVNGRKRATAGLLWAYESEGKPPPEARRSQRRHAVLR